MLVGPGVTGVLQNRTPALTSAAAPRTQTEDTWIAPKVHQPLTP
jgi:hypothetical protein